VRAAERRELRTLAIALLASLLVWNLPFGGIAMYPFKLLATWMHELSHGIAMLLSGAGFDHILIYRDTSGLAYARSTAGPIGSAVIAAAGYMGTPVWGGVLLVASYDARTARRALLVLAALLVGTALFVVAPTKTEGGFGPWATGAMGAVVLVCAVALPARVRLFIAHFIAAQACCNALLDIRVLMRPSQVVGGQVAGASDAANMASATFGTTATWAVWFWAIVWLAWSLGVLFVALRISGERAARIATAGAPTTASPAGESDRDERRRSPVTAPAGTDPTEPAGT
jgi:preprotein translocase subunit SecG